jgi:hypothetical protein
MFLFFGERFPNMGYIKWSIFYNVYNQNVTNIKNGNDKDLLDDG